jgi:hypothetical protein
MLFLESPTERSGRTQLFQTSLATGAGGPGVAGGAGTCAALVALVALAALAALVSLASGLRSSVSESMSVRPSCPSERYDCGLEHALLSDSSISLSAVSRADKQRRPRSGGIIFFQ